MTHVSDRPWTTTHNPTTFLLALYFFITLLSTQLHLALAQNAPAYFNPIPVSSPAFARAVTHLYIVGGAAASNPGLHIPQFLSLDLNVAWNTTTPAWSKHADGPVQDLFPAAFSADEKILYVFHIDQSSSPAQWDSNTEVWKSVSNVKFENATWQGIGAVTDPRTGLIYLAGGYNDDSNLSNNPMFLAIDVFDPVSQTVNRTHLSLPPSTFLARLYYGNVWCKARSSILYWGGNAYHYDPSVKVDMVSEFKVDSQTWSVMPTTGPTPPMRADHCMVPNEDGTKILIYGGRLSNNTVVGDVSILDTTTQTWTAGVPGQPRMYVACTVAGDQLLIWGGKAADNLAPPSDLIIYNFVTRTWITQYTPPAFYRDLRDPPPLNRTTAPWPIVSQRGEFDPTAGGGNGLVPGSSGGVPVGGIVGGVVAGVILVAVGIGLFVSRRRRQQRQGEEQVQGWDADQDEKGGGGFFDAWANGQSGLAVLKRRARPRASGGNSGQDTKSKEQKSPLSGEEELRKTLQEIQELENQQQELEQKRQQLVLQQQQGGVPYPPPPPSLNAVAAANSVQLRGPKEYLEPISEYRPPPNNPEYISPLSSALGRFADFGDGDAPGGGSGGGAGEGVAGRKVGERRTVQDTTGMSSNLVDWAALRPPLHPHAIVVNVAGTGRVVGPSSRAMSM